MTVVEGGRVHWKDQRVDEMEQLIEDCELDFFDEIHFESLVWG